ncbi:MAG: AAA family ATPase, partial [Bacteroidales bacterium]
NFKNTIIIMTSNLGSHIIQGHFETMNENNKHHVYSASKAEVMELLKRTIRPEFLNRIDEIIMFTPLSMNDIQKIVELQLNQLIEKTKEMGITLQYSTDALQYIAKHGYDPQFGARPVKRFIQKMVLNELSIYILSGKVHKDSTILLDSFGDGLVFRNI